MTKVQAVQRVQTVQTQDEKATGRTVESATCKDKGAASPFEQMLAELYHESRVIRRKSEVSSRTLSLRFGSDY